MIKPIAGTILLCVLIAQGFFLDWKLRGDIGWDWLWVLSPIWISVSIVLLLIGLLYVALFTESDPLDPYDDGRWDY